MLAKLEHSLSLTQWAYHNGLRARSLGLWLEDCPHKEPWLRTVWRRGWHAGERNSVPPTSLQAW